MDYYIKDIYRSLRKKYRKNNKLKKKGALALSLVGILTIFSFLSVLVFDSIFHNAVLTFALVAISILLLFAFIYATEKNEFDNLKGSVVYHFRFCKELQGKLKKQGFDSKEKIEELRKYVLEAVEKCQREIDETNKTIYKLLEALIMPVTVGVVVALITNEESVISDVTSRVALIFLLIFTMFAVVVIFKGSNIYIYIRRKHLQALADDLNDIHVFFYDHNNINEIIKESDSNQDDGGKSEPLKSAGKTKF